MVQKSTWDHAVEQINKVSEKSLDTLDQHFFPTITVIGLTTQRAWEMRCALEGRIDERLQLQFLVSNKINRREVLGRTRMAVIMDYDARIDGETQTNFARTLLTVITTCAKNGLQLTTDQLFIRV